MVLMLLTDICIRKFAKRVNTINFKLIKYMKKSFLLAAIALTSIIAPATFAKGGVKKQTPKQEAKAQKKTREISCCA